MQLVNTMWYYKLKEYVVWIILAALSCAVIALGIKLANEKTLIELGTGPVDSTSYAIGEKIKLAVETHTRYHVKLIPTKGSLASGEALRKADISAAILSPVALTSLQSLQTIDVVGQEYNLILVRKGIEVESLQSLKRLTLALGAKQSDNWTIGQSLLRSAGIADQVTVRDKPVAEVAGMPSIDGAIINSQLSSKELKAIVSSQSFALARTDGIAALKVSKPLYEWTDIPPGVFGSDPFIPLDWHMTLSSPLVLMVREGADTSLVQTLISVLSLPATRQSLAEFGSALIDKWRASPLLPKHPTVLEYQDPDYIFSVFRDALSLLVEYKWLSLLLLLAVIAWYYQLRELRVRRESMHKAQQKQAMEKIMSNVLRIEREFGSERDWKRLEQFLNEVNALKQQALNIQSAESYQEHALFAVVMSQCNHVSKGIENRISLSREQLKKWAS